MSATLTPQQLDRLEQLAEDDEDRYLVVGWDPAWGYSQRQPQPGPLIEDVDQKRVCRLTPKGKLHNIPSAEAMWALKHRREQRVAA